MQARLFCFVVIVCFLSDASAYLKNYTPLDDSELANRFLQRAIVGEFEGSATVRLGSNVISIEDDGNGGLLISGKDKSGKSWSFNGPWFSMEGAFYSVDLDNNGEQDLIYAYYTAANGVAPSTIVVTVLFDKEGRPIPSQMDGYFEFDSKGLQDLVDLNHDGRAELIRQSLDDGYWITSLYEARDAHWHLVHGQLGRYSFPLYTRYTYRANRVPTTPMAGHHPTEEDLSNSSIIALH